jgi:hypothetical protein
LLRGAAALMWVLALVAGGPARAATFTIVNLDGAGEGFNDPSPRAPIDGNGGTTLGQQRLNAFAKAAEYWGIRMASAVQIRVQAKMNPLTCSLTSAILGMAGAVSLAEDFPGAIFANTWYHIALANRLAGSDLAPAANDIDATFNSAVDDDPLCLVGADWYYGFAEAPLGTLSFIHTVQHELAHGLGFQSFVNTATGARLQGLNDIYMTFLEDHDLSGGTTWPNMTNSQREASAIDTGNLHWIGPAVQGQSGMLSSGAVGSHVRMYAPNPRRPGSSVHHYDTALAASGGTMQELMEPALTDAAEVLLSDELFQDEGWNAFGGTSCATGTGTINLNLSDQMVTDTQEFAACDSIVAGPNFTTTSSADVTFRAGKLIQFESGVEIGGSFTAIIEPEAFE